MACRGLCARERDARPVAVYTYTGPYKFCNHCRMFVEPKKAMNGALICRCCGLRTRFKSRSKSPGSKARRERDRAGSRI